MNISIGSVLKLCASLLLLDLNPIAQGENFRIVLVQRNRMKRHKLVVWIGVVIVLVACGCWAYGYWQFSKFRASLPPPTPTLTAEQIFLSRLLDGQSLPLEVAKFEVLEGSSEFGYSNRPTFIRFHTTPQTIEEIIEKDYGFYGVYTPVSCDLSPIKDDLIAEEWWHPSEVDTPGCYYASTCTLYDEKHLLIDRTTDTVYFYRTAICGLCPSGAQAEVLAKEPRCQQYRP